MLTLTPSARVRSDQPVKGAGTKADVPGAGPLARRLILACSASLIVYGLAFACVLDRPLTLGLLRSHLDATLARGAATTGPKLVILAGSNGPYSHRCEVIGPMVGRPCINAGVAVGVGLDYLFTRWQPVLRPGDLVYLPLEETQYARQRATIELGPDAAIMLRHDRSTLWQMGPHRQLAALFSSDLRGLVMSLLEAALVEGGFQDPRTATSGSTNEFGDHVGHTVGLAAANRSALETAEPFHPTAPQITAGYGSALVRAFLLWASAHQVNVIGGLPTGFADSPISDDRIAAIRAIYLGAGAAFLELPNRSRYPRTDFFDTPDHLNEAAQIRHSRMIGTALWKTIDAAQGVAGSAVRLVTTGSRPTLDQGP